MAEADKKDKKEKKEDEEAAVEAPPAKGGKGKLIAIIAVAGILLLVMAVGATVFVMKSGEKTTEQLAADAASHEENILPEGHSDEDEYDEGEEPLGAMYPLDSFVVNLSGGGFIRTQIQLEFIEREIPKRFYVRLTPIRDALISMLAQRRKEDIVSKDGKNELKNEIKESVNDVLKKEEVKNVYFTQFVVQ